ncbi:MAG: hypothetical protein ACK6DP_17440 [Gemmatimonas sp.]|uniref:hypothetical protein n=1 Tax=Gemmatimonas sp. TaxID=1962908 RepID=UPI00391F2B3C|nr:hypothetical protein [Gemmatimonadota bacterium]
MSTPERRDRRRIRMAAHRVLVEQPAGIEETRAISETSRHPRSACPNPAYARIHEGCAPVEARAAGNLREERGRQGCDLVRQLVTTLEGDRIVPEFLGILTDDVARPY